MSRIPLPWPCNDVLQLFTIPKLPTASVIGKDGNNLGSSIDYARYNLFFSRKVFIVSGSSDKYLIDLPLESHLMTAKYSIMFSEVPFKITQFQCRFIYPTLTTLVNVSVSLWNFIPGPNVNSFSFPLFQYFAIIFHFCQWDIGVNETLVSM